MTLHAGPKLIEGFHTLPIKRRRRKKKTNLKENRIN